MILKSKTNQTEVYQFEKMGELKIMLRRLFGISAGKKSL
jgi:hypothetical protein